MGSDSRCFRENLRAVLESRGMSRRDLSDASGVGIEVLNLILDTVWYEPRLDTVTAISRALCLPVGALVGEVPDV